MHFLQRWNKTRKVIVAGGNIYTLMVDDMIVATSRDFDYIESLVPVYTTRGKVRITSIPSGAKIYRRMAPTNIAKGVN